MKRIVVAATCSLLISSSAYAERTIDEVKAELVDLAYSYQGLGDPDRAIQDELQVLVDELLALNPQPPVEERLDLIAGTWHQVWGAYEYRNNDRTVDPTLGTDEIYQVVSEDGYYYNVSPNFLDGDRDRERVNLLRGVYRLDRRVENGLRVRFTEFPGVDPRPEGVDIWTLAEQAENGTLENEITIVPRWIVRLFFGGGTLVEVYTDDDLRITYGTQRGDMSDSYLYVMTRVE